EKISQVKGSFKKVMANIDKVLEAKLPLKIKTLSSKENINEIDKIKNFVESKGLAFSPSTLIFARLNGDITPCKYRLPSEVILKDEYPKEECETESRTNQFFRCATGNWQWHVDPSGKLNICSCVREPSYDILNGDITKAVRTLSEYVQNKRFSEDSECKTCKIWYICQSCPGKAKLEVGNEQAPVPYFCKLAKMRAKKAKILQI
ncbi:MAG: SPASM domain-containing protein, partial [Candidatus Omnitrophota bacterium]